jgi:hypothetical protein
LWVHFARNNKSGNVCLQRSTFKWNEDWEVSQFSHNLFDRNVLFRERSQTILRESEILRSCIEITAIDLVTHNIIAVCRYIHSLIHLQNVISHSLSIHRSSRLSAESIWWSQ